MDKTTFATIPVQNILFCHFLPNMERLLIQFSQGRSYRRLRLVGPSFLRVLYG